MAAYDHEPHWPQIKSLAEAQKHSALEEYLTQTSHARERVALLRFATRSLMFRDWSGKNLEPIILLGDRAIATALEIGDTDEANVICYNMSSNLAGCWNDGMKRNRSHFEKGLRYAERALAFRRELKKGPLPFSLAHWAKGIHLYFLGDFVGAETSFGESLKAAIQVAQAAGQPTSISKQTSFHILLESGYQALAQMAQGRMQAQSTLENVLSSFEEMKSISAEAQEDAEIGLSQLHFVWNLQRD